jgi:hypothetical protein
VEHLCVRHYSRLSRRNKRTPVFARAKPLRGQVVIDPKYPAWLKREGGSHLFICVPGDPEDFLYRGRRNPDGTRAGDQMALIDKLAQYGGNCIYMQIVRSHGGMLAMIRHRILLLIPIRRRGSANVFLLRSAVRRV